MWLEGPNWFTIQQSYKSGQSANTKNVIDRKDPNGAFLE